METKAIRGFNDVLPEEIGKWQFVEKTAREVFEGFGFSEIRIPILERTELFSRGIGEATDIVEKEMYTFTDRSGNSLTLRPEATASMARAYLEHQMYSFDPVAKLYCLGPMFRYERPQKGRYRQFYQIDAEVFGVGNPMVDAEVIIMVIHFLERAGLKNLELQINTLGCRECRPRYREELKEFFTGRSFQLCEDCQRRLNTNPLRIFDCKVESCKEAIASAPQVTNFICLECQNHFDQVKEYLDMVGLTYILNPRMVRGLDYYTRTAFEVVSYELGAQNAVTGGGRYDNLFQEIGGLDIPGIGFAIGVERLISLLPKEREFIRYPHLFVAVLNEESYREAYKLINQLHLAGIWAELDYEGKSLKSQMRRADKLKARYTLILGEEELKRGKVALRNMKEKSQEEISMEGIVNTLKSKIG
ncbi:MAG: histidine--tRNA ligase [Deltaproteobacteria bacterium RBG_16_47_11]|nr:MAG: histidine--tRNA ligase [Deltaproteobacteria bacterium RBG_16_47_11]